jgi:hypothetical protein
MLKLWLVPRVNEHEKRFLLPRIFILDNIRIANREDSSDTLISIDLINLMK